MNLNEVTTVTDLLKQNETNKSPLETVTEALQELDYKESREVVHFLLQNMLEWHRSQAVQLGMGDEPMSALPWADDAGRLAAVLALLETIN